MGEEPTKGAPNKEMAPFTLASVTDDVSVPDPA